jgi:hypothetical protein
MFTASTRASRASRCTFMRGSLVVARQGVRWARLQFQYRIKKVCFSAED